jgi:hypothetical protein
MSKLTNILQLSLFPIIINVLALTYLVWGKTHPEPRRSSMEICNDYNATLKTFNEKYKSDDEEDLPPIVCKDFFSEEKD